LAQILANNISDRTNPPGGARAIDIGAVRIWPGRCALVASEDITASVQALRGSYLEFGHLPAEYLASPPPPTEPMTEEELRAKLEKMSLKALYDLAEGITPPPAKRANAARMVHAILRACRNPDSLDPAKFFFTRHWKKIGPDTYVPVE